MMAGQFERSRLPYSLTLCVVAVVVVVASCSGRQITEQSRTGLFLRLDDKLDPTLLKAPVKECAYIPDTPCVELLESLAEEVGFNLIVCRAVRHDTPVFRQFTADISGEVPFEYVLRILESQWGIMFGRCGSFLVVDLYPDLKYKTGKDFRYAFFAPPPPCSYVSKLDMVFPMDFSCPALSELFDFISVYAGVPIRLSPEVRSLLCWVPGQDEPGKDDIPCCTSFLSHNATLREMLGALAVTSGIAYEYRPDEIVVWWDKPTGLEGGRVVSDVASTRFHLADVAKNYLPRFVAETGSWPHSNEDIYSAFSAHWKRAIDGHAIEYCFVASEGNPAKRVLVDSWGFPVIYAPPSDANAKLVLYSVGPTESTRKAQVTMCCRKTSVECRRDS